MSTLRITLLQNSLIWQNPEDNRKSFEKMIRNLSEPTDLIVLPEMFTTGFSMAPEECAEQYSRDMATLLWMKNLSKETGSSLSGSIAVKEEKHYFNRFVVAMPDGSVFTYDKNYLFSPTGEDKRYTAGNQKMTFSINGFKVCPLICYDLRFPELSRNKIVENEPEYDVLIYTANWPNTRTDHWLSLIKARAIENQCYAIGVNRVGTDENGLAYAGASCAFDMNGEKLFEPPLNKFDVVQFEVDKTKLNSFREKLPFLWDQKRGQIL